MSDIKLPLEDPPAYDASGGVAVPPPPPQEKALIKSPLPRIPFPLDLPILNDLKTQRVILASASPRRRQLLAQIGLTNLEIVTSTIPEDLPKTLSPWEYVLRTATQKALNVYEATLDDPAKGDPVMLIAADTVVVAPNGTILEKPRSEAQHIATLKDLRDCARHTVVTAVAVLAPLESARDPGYEMQTHVEETIVYFDKEVTDEMILAYVKTREGADKAGGYGIQGMGALLVEKIEGSFENVVGLPLRPTLKLLESVRRKSQNELFEEDSELDE